MGSGCRVAAVLLLGIAVGLAGCANSSAVEVHTKNTVAPKAGASPPAVPLDRRFVSVGTLAGSNIIELTSSADGTLFAWVAGQMTGTGSVIEIKPSGTQAKRSVTTADGQHPQVGFLHGFAATDEAVWMGAGTTLFRLDRLTGNVTARPLPEVPGSTPNSVEITSIIASAPRGLVIGLRAAPAVLIFNPDTAAFAQLRLPETAATGGLAVLADGTIGVGLVNTTSLRPDTVAIFSPSNRVTTTTAESILVSAWGEGFLTTGVGATSVGTDGSTARIDLAGSEGNSAHRPAELPDGRVVMLSNDRGLLVLDPTVKRVTATITLGTNECGLGEGSHVPLAGSGTVATVRQSYQCPASPDHLAAIGDDLLVDLGLKGLQRAPARSF